jgi:hypothetical protein
MLEEWIKERHGKSHEEIIAVFYFVLLKYKKENVLLSGIWRGCLYKQDMPDLTDKFSTA